MNDLAHFKSDELLDNAEKQMLNIYKIALESVSLELVELEKEMKEFDQKPTMTMIRRNKRLKELQKALSEIIVNANIECKFLLDNDLFPDVYGENYYYAAFTLESYNKDLEFPVLSSKDIKQVIKKEQTPFEKMAIKKRLNKKVVQGELTNQLLAGLLIGDSIDGIASKLERVVEHQYSSFRTIARTETTRLQNSDRKNIADYGKKEFGLELEKEWVATSGGRTRDTHRKADGQVVGIDEDFKVGKGKGQYPGDIGRAEEDINCRCTFIIYEKGTKLKQITQEQKKFNDWKQRKQIETTQKRLEQ